MTTPGLNSADAAVQRRESYRTDDGRLVYRDGSLVVKIATDAEHRDELLEQLRLLDWHAQRPQRSRFYPKVVDSSRSSYAMQHVAGGTMQERLSVEAGPAADALLTRALDALFTLSSRPEKRLGDGPSIADFLSVETDNRCARIERLERAQEHAADSSLTARMSSALAESARRTAPISHTASLPVAAHGDFVSSNIVFSNGQPVFIDPRAHWHRGTPYWDPIMDLASFVLFHCHLWDAMAKAQLRPATDLAVRTEDQILQLAQSRPGFQRWTALDPSWRSRYRHYALLRAVGNYANNRLFTRHHARETADITAHFVQQLIDASQESGL